MGRCITNDTVEPVTKRYLVESTPRGLVVDLQGGLKITSSVLDGPLKENEFTESELEIIVRAEEFAQPIHKALGPRINSGLYQFSHIVRGLEALYEFSKQIGVPVDFITANAFINHDSGELDKKVLEYERGWEDAVIRGDDKKIKEFESKLALARIEARDNMRDVLLEGNGLKISYETRLKTLISINMDYDLTRFTDKYPRAQSMAFQFVKKGNEGPANTFARFDVKNIDGFVNLLEDGLLYPEHVMEQGVMAFNDKSKVNGYVIGEELTKRFGGMREDGVEMATSVMVGNVLNILFQLQYFNETVNNYGEAILPSDVAEKYMLANHIKTKMTGVALDKLGKSIGIYESDTDILNRKEEVDQDILNKKKGRFYFEIEEDGFASNWVYRGLGGRRLVRKMDNDPEGKFYAYQTARHLREVVPMFNRFYKHDNKDSQGRPILINDSSDFDPKKHAYFTFYGINKALKPLSGSGFVEAVSELKKQTL